MDPKLIKYLNVSLFQNKNLTALLTVANQSDVTIYR